MGFDGFDAIETDDNRNAKTIGSFNLNLGFAFRHFLKKHDSKYLGIEMRYNWVNYATGGGSDLSGNTITLRLMYGLLGNSVKNKRLEALGHSY
jgi:hypothetical protein